MIIEHDVLRQEGAVVLVEVQLVEDPLLAGRSVFFSEHQSKFSNIRFNTNRKTVSYIDSIATVDIEDRRTK